MLLKVFFLVIIILIILYYFISQIQSDTKLYSTPSQTPSITSYPIYTTEPVSTTIPVYTTIPNTTIPNTTTPIPTIPNTTIPNTTIPNTTTPIPTIPNTTTPIPTTPIPVNCQIGEWSNFGDCIDGIKTRTRSTIAPPSDGGTCNYDLIDKQPCPVNCVTTGEWSNFSDCVNGIKTRTKPTISPQRNGGTCENVETVECRPIDCQIGEWSDFGDCVDGITTRTRSTIAPPSDGGTCNYDLVSSQKCSTQTSPNSWVGPTTWSNGRHAVTQTYQTFNNDKARDYCIFQGANAYTYFINDYGWGQVYCYNTDEKAPLEVPRANRTYYNYKI